MRSAEVACFQSHRKCWQEILDRGLEAALIIEDDVDIIDVEFTSAVDLAMKEIQMGDLVRFPIKPREKPINTTVKRDNISIFEPTLVGLGTQAQIVTYDAASQLLEKTEHFDRPIDVYLQLRWEHGVRILISCSKSLAINQCVLIRLKKSISLIVRVPDKITAVIIIHITKEIPVVIQAFFFKFGFAGAPA